MARHRAPPRWICPLCDRSVPASEATCYCGTNRAVVEAHARREQERTRRPFPWALFLGELGLIAVVVYWVFVRSDAPDVLESPAPVAMPTSAPGEMPVAAVSPLGEASAMAVDARVPREDEPEVVPSLPPAPTVGRPSPTPEPEHAEADRAREAGERSLEQTLTRLGALMARLDDDARGFEAVCLSRRGDGRSCARLYEEMASGIDTLGRGLEQADDDARRAWVSPGKVRDSRQKHGIEDGAFRDLAGKVHRLAVQYREGS